MNRNRPHPARRATHARLVMLALIALIMTGCGAADPRRQADAPKPSNPPGSPIDDVDRGGDDAVVTPTPEARRAGRSFDRLVSAYAPVTARINFLVTAETLRTAAVSSGLAADVEAERYGAVRLEIKRMHRVLERARPGVAAVKVGDIDQRRVQDLMLEAIRARGLAMQRLEATLDASVDGDVPDSEAERLATNWKQSWNRSLRTSREAMTTMQESRARQGLALAAEGAVR
ncbi:MAG: hypothetical protein ABI200_05555 [Gaiellales bacterium]